MRHFVIVGILVIVMAVLTYVGLDAAGFATQMNPVAASAQAQTIDSMWHWEIIAMSFLFALIVAPMAYSLVVFGNWLDRRSVDPGGCLCVHGGLFSW